MSNIVSTNKRGFEGRKVWFAFAAVTALLVAVGLFVILSQVTSTTTYYVLNQDTPARTQITENMLTEVVTSTGGQPPNALGLADVLATPTYALYELNAGDILTSSNTGPLTPINEGIPENFVVATFTAPASYAAGGKIARGDYIDLIAVDNESATYFLQHVLVLDATIDLDSVAASNRTNSDGSVTPAADSPSVRAGIPTLYTVGLSQEDAAKLALAMQGTIYVVLSADQSSDGVVTDVDITVDLGSLGGLIGNSGAGTDKTFGQGGPTTAPNPNTPTVPTPSDTETPNPTDTGEPELEQGEEVEVGG